MAFDFSVKWRWFHVTIWIGMVLLLIALIVPAIQQSRESARRMMSQNNLLQIGLALEIYHEVHRQLPSGGIFRDDGTAISGWPTALVLLLSQRSYHDAPDPRFPWDDSVNIDHNLHEREFPWQNPSVSPTNSPDGFPLIHYSGNQNFFYRNSVVRLADLTEKAATALVGDANGNFAPIGYPYQWRDLSLGLKKSPDGFGCPTRGITMFLMADDSVRRVSNNADDKIIQSLAGPESGWPAPQQVAKPLETYRLQTKKYWRYLHIVRQHKGLMTFRLSPNRKYLRVDFGSYDEPEEATPEVWSHYFHEFLLDSPVEHVELHGHLRKRELIPFLDLPTLKRLTISSSRIEEDFQEMLTTKKSTVTID